MQTINIQTKAFFEKIKERQVSMWDMLEQLISEEPKLILFRDEEDKIMMQYVLPTTVAQLKEDQAQFAKLFKEKLSQLN